MPTRTDGRCPYCGCDCFVSADTREVAPLRPDAARGESRGEWRNRCRGCGKWSVAVVVDATGRQEQREVEPQPEE